MNEYEYLDTNTPSQKINYSFSIYKGKKFLEAYKKSRTKVIYSKTNDKVDAIQSGSCSIIKKLNLWKNLDRNMYLNDFMLLLKRFEVTKKIYCQYDENYRPINIDTKYDDLDSYLAFSDFLIYEYKLSDTFDVLNALLKVNDILISNSDVMSAIQHLKLKEILKEELKFTVI